MSYSSDVLRGQTETIILAILNKGDSYGYEILKTINDNCNGLIEIRDATIYTAFKRMEQNGLISTYWGDENDGPRRKYYSITETGKQYYTDKLKEWTMINNVMGNLLRGHYGK